MINKFEKSGLIMLCGVLLYGGFLWLTEPDAPALQEESSSSSKSEREVQVAERDWGTSGEVDWEASDVIPPVMRGSVASARPERISDAELLTGEAETFPEAAERREVLRYKKEGLEVGEKLPSIMEALAPDPERSSGITSTERGKAIRALRLRPMTAEEQEFAYEFVKNATPPEGMPEGQYLWLSDEIFSALRLQDPILEEVTPFLTEIAQNSPSGILKDYAAQHLGHYHEQGVVDRVPLEEVLWEMTYNPEGTAAGAALIALSIAEEQGQLVNQYDLAARAQEILHSETTSEIKVEAVEILTQRGHTIAPPLLESLYEEAEYVLRNKLDNL